MKWYSATFAVHYLSDGSYTILDMLYQIGQGYGIRTFLAMNVNGNTARVNFDPTWEETFRQEALERGYEVTLVQDPESNG